MSAPQHPAAGSTPTPRHLAVVMDGNGRWARRRLLPRSAGHKVGADALKTLVRGCLQHQIPCLTVFAFSSENWKRPADEVAALMQLLDQMLERETAPLGEQGVQLRFIGGRDALSAPLRARIAQSEAQTAGNSRLVLNIALNYGGRWDIAAAARQLQLRGEPIDEASLGAALSMADLPEPDLFIRTGGDVRISNFLLWQLAYTELHFTDTLWPDFGDADLRVALDDFARRQRRFGGVGADALD